MSMAKVNLGALPNEKVQNGGIAVSEAQGKFNPAHAAKIDNELASRIMAQIVISEANEKARSSVPSANQVANNRGSKKDGNYIG